MQSISKNHRMNALGFIDLRTRLLWYHEAVVDEFSLEILQLSQGAIAHYRPATETLCRRPRRRA